MHRRRWRDKLTQTPIYKEKFAWFPTTVDSDKTVWLRRYYKKYVKYSSDIVEDEKYFHTDFIENISEEEYIVRKLSENL